MVISEVITIFIYTNFAQKRIREDTGSIPLVKDIIYENCFVRFMFGFEIFPAI